jgi:hypothetical protein
MRREGAQRLWWDVAWLVLLAGLPISLHAAHARLQVAPAFWPTVRTRQHPIMDAIADDRHPQQTAAGLTAGVPWFAMAGHALHF